MSSQLESIPESLIVAVCHYLEPVDICNLSLASHTISKLIEESDVWQDKSITDFGDHFMIMQLLKDAELDLGDQDQPEPSIWKLYYREKEIAMKNVDMKQLERHFQDAQNYVKEFQNSTDIELLSAAARSLLKILNVSPADTACYHMLGFILYVLNSLEGALVLLEIGRMLDNDFEPIKELTKEIQNILDGYQGTENDEPLLKNGELTQQVKDILKEIFTDFDEDQDDALNPQELSRYIYKTNGSYPNAAVLTQIGQRFDSNEKGWLTLDGFHAFYLSQTLDDPSETRRDLGCHGYDGRTLVKLNIAKPA